MRVKHLLILSAAVASSSGYAQSARAQSITIAEQFTARAGWALESDDSNLLARAGCLEPLTRIDFDGTLQPSLATSWTQMSPTTWEFTLREGVKFQDGQPLTPDAVSNALNNLLKVTTPARAFSPKLIKSVEAIGNNTIRITSHAPTVLLPYNVASPSTGILSPAGYQNGRINPIGTCTGPFIVVRAAPREGMTVKRNENYWGGRAALAGAEIRFIPDGNARAVQARSGEALISVAIPSLALHSLGSGLQIENIDSPRTATLIINNKKPALSDVKIRRAIQAAIDTAGLASVVYAGAAQPAVGPFGPKEPWAPKEAKVVKYDPAYAKELLKQAGIQDGALKLSLLAYNERGEFKDVAAVIQAQLREVGIPVDVRVAEYAALEPRMLSGDFDIALLSRNHLYDIADPFGFLASDYTCAGSYNLSHYCNKDVDAKVEEAGASVDIPDRHSVYADIARRLQDEAVNVFLVHEQAIDAVSKKVANYRPHPHDSYLLTKDVALR